MTKYFDDVSAEISGGRNSVDEITEIERRVVSHAVLVCGDREFPQDLREKIMSIIACEAIHPLIEHGFQCPKATQYAEVTKSSKLIEKLHEVFHEVAARQIVTRFGLLTDDPADILVTRDKWEKKTYGGWVEEE
jgi:hypothetical protein